MASKKIKRVTAKEWEGLNIEPGEIPDNLTDQQILFCYKYLLTREWGRFNATKAAEDAGYSKATARNQASRLLANANIKTFIGLILRRQLVGIKDKIKHDIIEKAIAIVTADLKDYVTKDGKAAFKDWKGVDSRPVKSVKSTPTANGIKWEIELHDPKQWADLLDKFMDIADGYDLKVKVESASDVAKMTDEQIEERLKQMKSEDVIKGG